MPRVTMPSASPGDQQGRKGTAPRAPGRDECALTGSGNAQGPTLAGPEASRKRRSARRTVPIDAQRARPKAGDCTPP
eukprot:12028774-Alexandrium_andersonii.AAC.1